MMLKIEKWCNEDRLNYQWWYTSFFLSFLISAPSAVLPRIHHGAPMIHVLRRQVLNFVPGYPGVITVIYQCSSNVTHRWFREAQKDRVLPYAELPNMLSAMGDSHYIDATMYAGRVTATSLVVKSIEQDMFPVKYTLVLTLNHMKLSHHVDIIIKAQTFFERTFLDAVKWNAKPSPEITFEHEKHFSIDCSATLDSESDGFLDEFHMFKTYLAKDRRNRDDTRLLVSENCGMVHRHFSKSLEKSANYLFEGKRKILSHGYIRYHLKFGIVKATNDDNGMYTCALERKQDHTYVSTWVQQGSLTMKPTLELLPCENSMYNKQEDILYFIKDKESCVRCRTYAYPTPSIVIFKDEKLLFPTQNLLIDEHISVAEGGIYEVTLTFLKPDYDDMALYKCHTKNIGGNAALSFSISILLS